MNKLILTSSFNSIQEPKEIDMHRIEAINTLEDMKEWIQEDMFNGNMDQSLAELYIENIDGCIRNVQNINQNSTHYVKH